MAIPSNSILGTPIYQHQPQYKLVPKPLSTSFYAGDPKDLGPMAADFEYEVVRVPAQMPYIDKGNHPYSQYDNQYGRPSAMRIGCTMELVSVLAGERWTNRPSTAHPHLGHIMIGINDALPDQPRQKMLGLVPRLIGTNDFHSMREFDDLINKLDRHAYRARGGDWSMGGIEHLLKSAHHLLDVFDQRTGRPTRKLDEQVLTQLMTALAA